MNKIKYIDLSHPITERMQVFPSYWHPKVEVTRLGKHKSEGRATSKITFGSHTGTHMDAPLHFIPGGKPIDKIPLNICIGQAMLLDLRGCKKVTIKDLQSKLAKQDKIERLVARFDWSKRYGSGSFYNDYPFFTEEACRWLVEKGVKLLGMDTPSPDDPKDNRQSGNDSPNHKLLLRRGVVMIEYLCNLNLLKGPQVFMIALPLKIKGADGSPARVVAYDL